MPWKCIGSANRGQEGQREQSKDMEEDRLGAGTVGAVKRLPPGREWQGLMATRKVSLGGFKRRLPWLESCER